MQRLLYPKQQRGGSISSIRKQLQWLCFSLLVLLYGIWNVHRMLVFAHSNTTVAASTLPTTSSVTQEHPSLHQNAQKPSFDQQQEPHLLESLMYKYGSDKSKDDHSYTDLYQMLFDPIRLQVRNMTEIGVAAGQSIQAWYHYFPRADIHAFDIETTNSMQRIAKLYQDRVHYQQLNLLKRRPTPHFDQAHLMPQTMDLIIEDATHASFQQSNFLQLLFPLVKPGGYYIIEDIAYLDPLARYWKTNITALPKPVQEILYANDVLFVDTHVGHRAWDEWKRRSGPHNAVDHVYHNSHVLVIRKRVKPLPNKIQMNLRRRAMEPSGVVYD